MSDETENGVTAGQATAEHPAPEAGAEAAGGGTRPSDADLREALEQVYDPEIGIDIVSLGLVYDTAVDEQGMATVDMTLTSPYCPMGSIIQTQVHAVLTQVPGVEDVRVNLVWSPPWDPRVMASDEAKLELGIY